ncbi:MAG: hypothetical protein JWL81_1853 [Verrucomicrobiales bacterium]|nr:hypothetical protein [Verrucomicrobiales bacterium]
MPRELAAEDPSAADASPVKGPHGNRVPLEKKSMEGVKPFTRFITRPETTVAANTASETAPSERVISAQNPGPAFGKIKSNEELNYRPNRLQSVINDTWTYSPLTWLDQLGKVRLIIGLIVISAVVAGVLWKFGTEVQRQTAKDAPAPVAAAPVDFAPRQLAIRRAFEAYLASTTIVEKRSRVIEPERVEARMKDFYETRGEKDPPVPTFEVSLPVKAGGEWWFKLNLLSPDGRNSLVLMKETPNGGLLDWENFVAYGSMPWSRFTSEKPSDPQSLRVQMRPATRPLGKYTTEDYFCFEIAHRAGPPILHGYASRSSRTGLELAKRGAETQWQSMNLYLKWEADAAGSGSVVISDIIRNNWLDAVNDAKPDETQPVAPTEPVAPSSNPTSETTPAPAPASTGGPVPANTIQSLDAFPSRAAKSPGASAPSTPSNPGPPANPPTAPAEAVPAPPVKETPAPKAGR